MSAILNYRAKEDVCKRGFLSPHYAPHLEVYRPPCKRTRVTAPFCFSIEEEVELIKRQHQENQSSIDTLPDECLFEILRRLDGPKERCSSACVSKHWLGLLSTLRSSEIPKKVKLPDLNEEAVNEDEVEFDGCLTRSLEGKEATDARLAAIAVGSASRGGLAKLFIQGSNPTRGVTDKGLSAIARGCSSLRVLSIWNVSGVTDAGLSEIAQGCPMLEKLDLTSCPQITDKGLISVARNCPNLTSLTVESCRGVGNEGLQAIGQGCPKINSLTIKNCPLVGDTGISSLISSTGVSLTKVKLQNLNISDNGIAFLGYYGKAVTDLTMSGLPLVGERGFWVMANALGLQNLKNLTITSCPGLTDLGLVSIARCCPGLKQVYVRKSCLVSDAGLKAFSEAAKMLEILHLEECNRITLNGVLASVCSIGPKFKSLALVKCLGIKDINVNLNGMGQIRACESLRFLTIRDCPGFTDAGLAMIGRICPMLENIELSRLGDVTDHGILPLIENSAGRLVKVNLCNNANLTDLTVTSLVKANGNNLKSLNLEGCKKVTDKSLFEIAEKCVVLDELDLSGCMVSDYGVAVLASASQLKLRVVSLAGCVKVTCKSAPFLGNFGRSLQGLNLQFCNMMSNYNLASLENKLWWCDILY